MVSTGTDQIHEYKKVTIGDKEVKMRTEVVVVTYSLLHAKVMNENCPFKFKVVIVDESHMIRTYSAKRTKECKRVTKDANRVILLSGTPALHKPMELFTQFECIMPNFQKKHMDHWQFGKRFCEVVETLNKYGEFTKKPGRAKTGPAAQELRNLMNKEIGYTRRLKTDVLGEIPEKMRTVLKVRTDASDDDCKSNCRALGMSKVNAAVELVRKIIDGR
eukprot:UN22907